MPDVPAESHRLTVFPSRWVPEEQRIIEQLEPADGTPFGEGLIGRIYDYVHGPGEYQRQIQQGETADEQLTPFERSLQQRMQDYANQK
ncbi:MAG TPA: hypothetical protein VFT53_03900 [Candidatus Saccharimonadales bacterium]|nr:hypothetical protein [Candidatus Saccharimonadales bacterium]